METTHKETKNLIIKNDYLKKAEQLREKIVNTITTNTEQKTWRAADLLELIFTRRELYTVDARHEKWLQIRAELGRMQADGIAKQSDYDLSWTITIHTTGTRGQERQK